MHLFRLTDAFDGCDLIALVQSGEGEARKLAPPIDVDSARAALTMIASFFGAGQMQMFPQTIEKSRAGIDPKIVLLPIHLEGYGNRVLRIGWGCVDLFQTVAGIIRAAEVNKPGIPSRERNVRRVDCPNPLRASAFGSPGVLS